MIFSDMTKQLNSTVPNPQLLFLSFLYSSTSAVLYTANFLPPNIQHKNPHVKPFLGRAHEFFEICSLFSVHCSLAVNLSPRNPLTSALKISTLCDKINMKIFAFFASLREILFA
jgi:hypothetical protein